jgi:hypothetical protein
MLKNQVCSQSTSQQISIPVLILLLDLNKSSEELINWISAISFNQEHHQALDQHSKGTGTWILESSEFQQWVANEFRVLWCPGNRELCFNQYLECRMM